MGRLVEMKGKGRVKQTQSDLQEPHGNLTSYNPIKVKYVKIV